MIYHSSSGKFGYTWPNSYELSPEFSKIYFNEQLAIASKFTSVHSKLELAGYSVNISMPNTDNSHPQLFLKLKLFSSFLSLLLYWEGKSVDSDQITTNCWAWSFYFLLTYSALIFSWSRNRYDYCTFSSSLMPITISTSTANYTILLFRTHSFTQTIIHVRLYKVKLQYII